MNFFLSLINLIFRSSTTTKTKTFAGGCPTKPEKIDHKLGRYNWSHGLGKATRAYSRPTVDLGKVPVGNGPRDYAAFPSVATAPGELGLGELTIH